MTKLLQSGLDSMKTAKVRSWHLPARSRSFAGRMAAISLLFFLLFFGAFLSSGKAADTPQSGVATPDYTKNPEAFPNIFRPYLTQKVPPPDLNNSPAVPQMIHDGKLRLSVAEFVHAVMENNLDIASARYNRYFSQTDILRAKAGQAPRGSQGVTIPGSLFSGAVGAGLGNTNAGVTGAVVPASSGGGRSVTVAPRGGFDPALGLNFSLDHTSSPLNSSRITGVANSVTSTATLQMRYVQAFTSGTTFDVSFNTLRQSSNQTKVRFNPAYVPFLRVDLTQQLLSGFGFANNRRLLEVAKNGREIAREVFRQQATTTLVQAQNSYWNLVAFQETVRAAEKSLEVSQQLYENNKRQAEIGTLAQLDVISAESEVASRQRDLIVARTNLQQAEVQIKTLLSRRVDPELAAAQIETTDPLPQPQDADIPKLDEAISTAMQNRAELPQAQGNILNEQIAVKFTRDALRPSLVAFAQFTSLSLFEVWTPAFTDVFYAKYPDYAVGLSLTIPLRNRSAQADNIRTRLEEQQAETSLQRTRNQVSLEVRKAVIGLMQAKSQVEAAHQAVVFSQQTVDAEQKKLNAGISTNYNVILVERDLLTAQLAEVQARANYAKARVEMDRSTGVTLEKNHVDPAEVPRARLAGALLPPAAH